MVDVTLPQLGESVTEGTLGKWLKQVGDAVTKYEPLVEVVTDKVNAEVPSDFDGTLAEIVVQEGDTVSVGTVICRIQEAGSQAAAGGLTQPTAAVDGTEQTVIPVQTTAPQDAVPANAATATPVMKKEGAVATGARGRYSPAVLKVAQEHNIDLTQVAGSGAGGRITRKDVQRYLESGGQSSVGQTLGAESQTASASTQGGRPDVAENRAVTTVGQSQPNVAVSGDEIIDPSPIRKTIAKRMVESKHTAPHAWTMVEADVTKLVTLRQQVKNEFQRKEGISLTYLPFFIKAVAEALKQYPMLNAAWIDNQIHVRQDVNISIAVATDDVLVVPVIRHADRLSIAGLAHAVNDLAARARSGRLQMDDVQGGTFTVNNTGAFGSILSNAIINMPQAAILSVESIVKRPVVIQDAIAIRSMVNLCLSLDHRILDGWISGKFLKAVRERLEGFDGDTTIY